MARKPLRCRLGFYRWLRPQHDEHGQRCVGCVRCPQGDGAERRISAPAWTDLLGG